MIFTHKQIKMLLRRSGLRVVRSGRQGGKFVESSSRAISELAVALNEEQLI